MRTCSLLGRFGAQRKRSIELVARRARCVVRLWYYFLRFFPDVLFFFLFFLKFLWRLRGQPASRALEMTVLILVQKLLHPARVVRPAEFSRDGRGVLPLICEVFSTVILELKIFRVRKSG